MVPRVLPWGIDSRLTVNQARVICHAFFQRFGIFRVVNRYLLHVRLLRYDSSMSTIRAMSLRLSGTQRRQLEKLSEKLQIDKTNVVRLAITRLAEQEGVSRMPR